LYEICKKVNHRTYRVSRKEEINKEWFKGNQNVGVCGATSTPRWLMEEVMDEVKNIND